MGLLDTLVRRVLGGRGGATRTAKRTGTAKQDPPWGGRRPDKADYGRAGAPTPDLEALVSAAEIEAVTGSRPVGEPRRNGPEGTETDLGRHVICEWKLANGDEFLISLGNCANASAAQLSMDRLAEYEKAFAGVGERGLVRVKTSKKDGTSEVGVTALQRNFTVALVHTSTDGRTDPAPVGDLLRTVLTRL